MSSKMQYNHVSSIRIQCEIKSVDGTCNMHGANHDFSTPVSDVFNWKVACGHYARHKTVNKEVYHIIFIAMQPAVEMIHTTTDLRPN